MHQDAKEAMMVTKSVGMVRPGIFNFLGIRSVIFAILKAAKN